MREMIPHKMVVDFEQDGSLKNGVMLYRIRENGTLSKGYRSISIKGAGYGVPSFNNILAKIRKHVRTAENIPES